MHVISLAGATSVKNPRTEELHEADGDGVFRSIPLDFAHELVTRHASQWREESAHQAAQHQAGLDQLRSPHAMPKAVAELRERLAKAEARIDALESAGPDGASEGSAAAGGLEPDPRIEPDAEKPTRARKTAAAKTTASKRTAGARKAAVAKPKTTAAADGADGSAEELDLEDETVEDQVE